MRDGVRVEIIRNGMVSIDEVGGFPNRGMHLNNTHFLRRATIRTH